MLSLRRRAKAIKRSAARSVSNIDIEVHFVNDIRSFLEIYFWRSWLAAGACWLFWVLMRFRRRILLGLVASRLAGRAAFWLCSCFAAFLHRGLLACGFSPCCFPALSPVASLAPAFHAFLLAHWLMPARNNTLCRPTKFHAHIHVCVCG